MNIRIFMFLIAMVMFSCQEAPSMKESIHWKLDNLQNINGHAVTVLGNPEVVDINGGAAIQFNGQTDAIVLDNIPVPDFAEFTIEVVFRPDSNGNEAQRFFHIQESNDHRILMETRLVEGNQWFLDTFIKSGENEHALFAKEFLHPTDLWYHLALVYDGEMMRHYVNGSKEMESELKYEPIQHGETSIGCRLNRVYWFKGAIREIHVTPSALSPDGFELRELL